MHEPINERLDSIGCTDCQGVEFKTEPFGTFTMQGFAAKARRLDDVIAYCENTIRQAGAVRPGKASGNADKVLQIAKGEDDE